MELADPEESPSVITLAAAPKAFALDVPASVPDLIKIPLVNVLLALSVRIDVLLF